VLEKIGANLEHYMDLLAFRQKLVTSNIANADTPGFHALDIDFAALVSSSTGSEPLVNEIEGLATKTDGNNVSLEREMRLLAENGLRFQVASGLLRSELSAVRMAIQEGKSA